MLRNIFKKRLSFSVTFGKRQRHVNYGLIIAVVLGTFISWWLGEYIVYQLKQMDQEITSWIDGSRPEVTAQTQPVDIHKITDDPDDLLVIDVVTTAPYSEYGTGRIVNSTIGSYREAGDRRFDRFAYFFETQNEGDWIRMILTYPDDKPRMTGILHIGNSGLATPSTSINTGYITGYTFPITNQMVSQVFYFPAAITNRFGITFQTDKDGAPAAVKSIQMERLTASEDMPVWPAESQQPNRRKFGRFWEDPVLASDFYRQIRVGDSETTKEQKFQTALDRHIEYLNRIGHNSVIYPVVWYWGGLYSPSPYERYYDDDGYGGFRYHPAQFHVTMAQAYSAAEIDFWPMIRNWELPSSPLNNYKKSAASVENGTAGTYVNAVTKDGEVKTGSSWSNPPVYNCIHPQVRTAYNNIVREIATALKDETSFKGVTIWHAIHSATGFGTPDQSYDDYTLNLFAQENGLTLPNYTGSTRFNRWYNWLQANHWNVWINWRKQKQTEIYDELAQTLTSVKPGAKLLLNIDPPDPIKKYDAYNNSYITDVSGYLDDTGMDIAAIAANPDTIIFRRHDATRYFHTLRSKDENSASMQELLTMDRMNYDADWQSPFIGITQGAVIWYAYFEGQLNKWHGVCDSDSTTDTCEAGDPDDNMCRFDMYCNGECNCEIPGLRCPSGWNGWEQGWRNHSEKGAVRYSMEDVIKSIGLYDPMFVNHGSMNLDPSGMEEYLQPVAAAFTSLPAVPFNPVSDDGRVVVREVNAEGAHWIYAVNITATNQTATINFSTNETLTELGLNPQTVSVSSGQPLTAPLEPFNFRAWKSTTGAGPYCGDTNCDSDETCRSCPADCGACPPPAPAVSDYTPVPPVIDGQTNEWGSINGILLNYTDYLSNQTSDPPTGNSDLSAIVKSMWDANNLYVLIEVTDDFVHQDSTTLYLDDSTELYLDGLNNKAAAYDTDDFQLTVDINNHTGGTRYDQLTWQSAVTRTANSYAVEYSIPFSALGITPGNNTAIGFDIAVNDDDDGADTRESQLMWNGDGTNWRDPSQFGEITLTGQSGATPCHRYTPTDPVSSGYGSAYNLGQNNPSELLVRTTCDTSSVNLDVGNGDANMLIYERGHIYDGANWQSITLSGANQPYIGWYAGNAGATDIPVIDMNAINYIVAYTCYWNGQSWRCGCADSACTDPCPGTTCSGKTGGLWQLQAFGN